MESIFLLMTILSSLFLPSIQDSTTSKTFSSSSNYRSTTTTTSTDNIHVHSGHSVILKSYSLGGDGVMCQHRARPNTVQPGNNNLVGAPVAVNLTAVNCQVQCYPRIDFLMQSYSRFSVTANISLIRFVFQDWGRLKFNLNFRVNPSRFWYKSLSENQRKENPLIEYTWARLGCETNRVVVQCEASPYEQPEGGSCIFGKRHMTDSYSVEQGEAYMNLRHSGDTLLTTSSILDHMPMDIFFQNLFRVYIDCESTDSG
ncbi:uncharacterized protein MELLADRAFT_64894 [Melampsora larici-populina 98AG31]|uniref:Secreted protein n=1 Tax=Melampsora larici-populina (strain 98AG31 / pathotype 3-4-7) TaxID=747676 RepID=F4RT68_MELLP|nr:uncharacterized protein MELLADRAFT_64894 [Melampsora larici-populina 98AG31]EGG04454.1 hypothetical protein MELLADRAFT_64894 [Melampsora larici-populina 98AG31]